MEMKFESNSTELIIGFSDNVIFISQLLLRGGGVGYCESKCLAAVFPLAFGLFKYFLQKSLLDLVGGECLIFFLIVLRQGFLHNRSDISSVVFDLWRSGTW